MTSTWLDETTQKGELRKLYLKKNYPKYRGTRTFGSIVMQKISEANEFSIEFKLESESRKNFSGSDGKFRSDPPIGI